MKTNDALEFLELTAPISKFGLRKAYREALQVWHPGRFTGNDELKIKAELKTSQINEAYVRLSCLLESEYPYQLPVKSAQKQTEVQNTYATPPPQKSAQTESPQPPLRKAERPATPPQHQTKHKSTLKEFIASCKASHIYSIAACIVIISAAYFFQSVFKENLNQSTPKKELGYQTTASFEWKRKEAEARQKLLQDYSEKTKETQKISELLRKLAENSKKFQDTIDKTKESLTKSSKDMERMNSMKLVPPLAQGANSSVVQNGWSNGDKFKHLPTDLRLNSGSIIVDKLEGMNGKGKLNLDNGLAEDAHVKMVRNEVLVASFYVRGSEKFAFGHIPDGSYRLLYCTGYGWDSAKHDFTRGRSASRYDQPLTFATRQRTEGQQIIITTDVLTLTLHKVLNGNAKASNISLAEFDRY